MNNVQEPPSNLISVCLYYTQNSKKVNTRNTNLIRKIYENNQNRKTDTVRISWGLGQVYKQLNAMPKPFYLRFIKFPMGITLNRRGCFLIG